MMAYTLLACLLVTQAAQAFQPSTVNYADIADGQRFQDLRVDKVFERALGVDGILAITGIPRFAGLREKALQQAHACIVRSPRAQLIELSDGTIRRTLAASSSIATGRRTIDHGSDSEACRTFARTSQTFREMVGDVTDVFTKRLSRVLDIEESVHLLRSQTGTYRTLEQVVAGGERLEHFHSYRLPSNSADSEDSKTIDFHVDQGVFIAFTPAILVDESSDLSPRGSTTGSFTVRTKDGEELEVEFPQDSLVLLAGDGFNQYINKKHGGMHVHTPAHAFRMPSHASGLHRVWFGMMQLPPKDAVSEESGLTFGNIREQVVEASRSGGKADALALGCSRRLAPVTPTCAGNQVYCWHRCMNHSATVSPSACAAKFTGFNCTSQFDQIYRSKDGHGDYNPAFTNSTSFVTKRPPVVQPTGACTGWQALVSDSTFAHRVALGSTNTYLLWNVVGNKIQAKMIRNSLVGWMAIGLTNVGGRHKGMNGARVVMGLNNPQTGSTMAEYRIDAMKTAWRHW